MTQPTTDARTGDATLAVDVVSDLVCPWCFIGKRKLEVALADLARTEPTLNVTIRWHPFELNPGLPREGISRATYLAQKFGGAARAADVYARVKHVGETVGIPFRFDAIERQPNTFDGHRLVAWAQLRSDPSALVERLFHAYFVEGRFIGNRDELVRIAAEAGLPADDARAMLESDAMRQTIIDESRESADVGIQGVPFLRTTRRRCSRRSRARGETDQNTARASRRRRRPATLRSRGLRDFHDDDRHVIVVRPVCRKAVGDLQHRHEQRFGIAVPVHHDCFAKAVDAEEFA